MEHIASFIEHLIVTMGAVGIFLGSVIEEIVVVIPSTLVQTGAGFFLLAGNPITLLSILKLIFLVALPVSLGVTIGSLLIYALCYYGGMPFIERFGKYFFISYRKVESARERIVTSTKTIKILTILRFIPLFPNTVLTAVSGLLKIKLVPYMVSTFIGIFIRAIYLGAIGWFAGNYYGSISTYHSLSFKFLTLFLVLIIISAITGILVKYFYKLK
jgi:membrane protein DedA with SNARE-associated domain